MKSIYSIVYHKLDHCNALPVTKEINVKKANEWAVMMATSKLRIPTHLFADPAKLVNIELDQFCVVY